VCGKINCFSFLSSPLLLEMAAGGVHSVKQGKVDSLNGRRGMVVSLDVEEYERVAELFGFLRVPGDGAHLLFFPALTSLDPITRV